MTLIDATSDGESDGSTLAPAVLLSSRYQKTLVMADAAGIDA